MRNLRRTIQLKGGVKVDTLFTPHLFSFKEEKGLTLQITEDIGSVLEAYADIYYLAALNAWVLDGHGSVDDFPHTRGDFHAYMMAQPVQFAKDVDFAVQALTGKSLKEMKTEEKPAETPVESKKKRCGWIGRLLRRSS
jgi:hypothetical protein